MHILDDAVILHGADDPRGPAAGARSGRTRARVLVLAVAAASGACARQAPPRLAPRPPGCTLEVVKSLPARPYIELETFALPSPESLREVLDRVQDRACQDGADAIYAPKAGRAYSYAIALKWQDARGPAGPQRAVPVPASPPPPAAPPPAAPATVLPAPPPPGA